jgi:hypothetical protein
VEVAASGTSSRKASTPLVMNGRFVTSSTMVRQSKKWSNTTYVARCRSAYANAKTPSGRRMRMMPFHPVARRSGVTASVAIEQYESGLAGAMGDFLDRIRAERAAQNVAGEKQRRR